MKKSLTILLTVLLVSLVLVSCDNSVSSKGKINIISVGDNFTGNTESINVLKTCENDANAVKEVFEKRATEAGYSVSSTVFIGSSTGTDNATVANLKSAISDLKTGAASNDISVIYVSTHGSNDITKKVDYSTSNDKNGYFILETKTATGQYAFSDFLSDVNEIPGTVLIIADLCYSGALIEQNNVTYNVNNYTGTDPVRILFSDGTVKESSKTFVLAASTYFQESQAGSTVNDLSVMTDYLLKALGMSNYNAGVNYASSIPAKKSNKILLSDVYGYVYKESKKDNKAQIVQMSSGTNDLVLFSY